MSLTSGSAGLLKTAVDSFWTSYYAIPDSFAGLVDVKNSTQEVDTYPRLGAAPMPQAWDGDRDAKAAPELTFTGTNKPYDSTIKVDKKYRKFDQLDLVGKLTANQGSKAMDHRLKLMTTLLTNGAAAVGDDGQFYFDTDHADPGAEYTTSQDNDRTAAAATGTQPTDLEFAAAIRTCFDALWGFKDDRGDPMVPADDNAANFIAMVPPVYRSVARRVMLADSLTGPVANDVRGTFTVRVNPFMTGADLFYFFYAGSNHKPIVLQQAGGIELTPYEDPHSGHFYFSASWWGVAIYGQWRTSVLFTFT